MKPSSRFVAVAQWVAPVVVLAFAVAGRGLFGSVLGWFAVIFFWASPVLLIALYIPPILTRFDREVRAAKKERAAYSVTTSLVWTGLVVAGFGVVDGGDDGITGSVLTAWGVLDNDASMALAYAGWAAACIALAASFALAVVGVVLSRRAA